MLWASSYISYSYPNNNYIRGVHVCLHDSEICQEKERQKSGDYNLLQCHTKSSCHGIYLNFNYIHGTQKVVWETTCQSKANQICFHAEQLPQLYVRFLRAYAKLRKATITFVLSVCPSVWKNSALTGRSFKKFNI